MFINNPLLKRSLVLRTIASVSLIISALAVVFLLNSQPAMAAEIDEGITQVNNAIALGASDPRIIITRIINIALGFLGILAVGLVLYAGYLWMTSGGDEEKVRKAKKILINAVIGLAIILSAWGITLFILNKLGGATGLFNTNTDPGTGGGTGGGALGNGIIESHYPARNAMGVPRNTKIMVTFKEAMAVDTIMDEATGQINSDNIKIYRTYCTGPDGACQAGYNEGFDNALSSDKVNAAKTADDKTFIFDPVDWLGSPDENIWYTVYLGGGINKANGDSAFGGLGSYDWQFEVSTVLDLDPPNLISVVPKHCADQATCGTWARNVIVQFNFNEAMD
ncbi:MAG: Ig-like domain-containing protein, partial [bacterium]